MPFPFTQSSSPPTDPADIEAIEKKLGFAFPASYKKLLTELGHGPYTAHRPAGEGKTEITDYNLRFNDPRDGRQDEVPFCEGVFSVKSVPDWTADLCAGLDEDASNRRYVAFMCDLTGNPVCFHRESDGAEPRIVKHDDDYGMVPIAENFEAFLAMVEAESDVEDG